MKKKVVRLVTGLVAFILAFQVYIYMLPITTSEKKCSAILILGCRVKGEVPSAFLMERTRHGAELFKKGYGEYIIVSGGKGSGEDISEAEAMKRILIEEGVPKEKIIEENKSTSTAENLKFSSKIIKEKDFNDVLIVSNEFHLRRASILAKKNNIKASYSGVFVSGYKYLELYGGIREIPAIIKDVLLN
ncbi:DUF218 domain-containing protein [Clostridium cavendishii DSM 21758]|uniref:DUF218 domain-containing protein n=1 Tax=Clostridium cavendishii DSM 21758 TaxID=1121302 RepID=A0A1M6PAR2_9CLOT|nr:YdcF family protein [Clostridium cavendishii]SHK05035.1 DUF218 domain-containing protein [Clostridium cavendishii DSM 21758]